VTVFGLVLNVGGVDGDAACFFFWGCVDLVVRFGFAAEEFAQHRGDGRCQGGLAMVDVTNGGLVRSNLPFAIFNSPSKEQCQCDV
jgi:hypothetical protein